MAASKSARTSGAMTAAGLISAGWTCTGLPSCFGGSPAHPASAAITAADRAVRLISPVAPRPFADACFITLPLLLQPELPLSIRPPALFPFLRILQVPRHWWASQTRRERSFRQAQPFLQALRHW